MSYVNTQISLLQLKFSRYYSYLIGCISSVKTRLASVGVSQVYSPYSAHFGGHSFVIIRISRLFPEQINEFDHFVRMVATVFMEHRYAGVLARKYT